MKDTNGAQDTQDTQGLVTADGYPVEIDEPYFCENGDVVYCDGIGKGERPVFVTSSGNDGSGYYRRMAPGELYGDDPEDDWGSLFVDTRAQRVGIAEFSERAEKIASRMNAGSENEGERK